ncbi:Uma2 family endonuclease [soil metagenome]
MRAQRYLPNYTIADYLLWEGDWELIDGVPSAMTPAPTKRHQMLAFELVLQIGNALKKLKDNCGNCRIVYETDWEVNDNTVFCPDIAVICNDNEGDVINKPPVIIIEIISPSSGIKDRHTKFGIYQEHQVPYYLIVDPIRNTHNVFVLVDGQYEERNDTQHFHIQGTCSITLDVMAAFAGLPG